MTQLLKSFQSQNSNLRMIGDFFPNFTHQNYLPSTHFLKLEQYFIEEDTMKVHWQLLDWSLMPSFLNYREYVGDKFEFGKLQSIQQCGTQALPRSDEVSSLITV